MNQHTMKPWHWYAVAAAAVALFALSRSKTEPTPPAPPPGPPGPSGPPLSVQTSRKHLGVVLDAAAERYRLPPALVRAVAWVESRWNPLAGSPVGAVGLLQLMPGTAVGLGVTDRTDPVQNANGGAKFLSNLYLKAGSWPVALAAYNWGPGRVFGSATRSPALEPSQWPPATQAYVRNVLDAQARGVA